MPMIFAAAGEGWAAVAAVVLAYEVATIGTMVVLVTIAHAGARTLHAPWLDRYGDAVAGRGHRGRRRNDGDVRCVMAAK